MTNAAGAAFEPLATGFYLEGLLVEGDDVWFTDVTRGGVRRVGSDVVLLPERHMVGGLLMNGDGRMLVAGPDDISWADLDGGASGVVAGGFGGTNEMCADPDGGILFGTIDLPAILRGETPGPSTVIRVAPDLAVSRLYEGLAFANGVAMDEGGTTLFLNETFGVARAFPVGPGLTLGEPRMLADKPDCDGMAMDADGNVWITGYESDHLLCLAPDGTEVRRLALPGKACTSLRFGGADLRDLYVNLVNPASALALKHGTPITEQDSVLYRTRSPVAGATPRRPALRIS